MLIRLVLQESKLEVKNANARYSSRAEKYTAGSYT